MIARSSLQPPASSVHVDLLKLHTSGATQQAISKINTGFFARSLYSRCWLADQSDVVIHIDTTKAVRPLEEPDWDNEEKHEGDLAETCPYGY